MPKKLTDKMLERVFIAADELVTEGLEAPTNEKVREKLGSGSFSDISAAMKIWRSQNQNTASSIEIPEPIKKMADRSTTLMWSKAIDMAKDEFESKKSALERQSEEHANEKEEAFREIERLENEISLLKSSHKQLTKEAKEGNNEIKQMLHKISSLNAKVSDLSARLDEKSIQLEQAMKERAEQRQNNTKLQEELISLHAEKIREKPKP